MQASDTAAIDKALENSQEMMAKDGYTLTWHLSGEDAVVVQVEAGPDACADCLSPTPVMEAIMGQALSSTPYRLDHVVLPNEH
nr:hypothetical protein BJQ95_02303 [Cryobacterium sp. SO1]